MKLTKLTSIVLSAIIAVSMMPLVPYAAGSPGHKLDVPDDGIIIVYDKMAECSETIRDSEQSAVDISRSEEVQQVASDCAVKIADATGSGVASEEIIADSLGADGAVLHIRLEDDADTDAVIETLNEDPEIAYAQPNYTYELMNDLLQTSVNDSYKGYQYYLYDWKNYHGANVLNAWDRVKTSKKVTVAVLDSGIDLSHNDLAANLDLAHAAYLGSTINDTVGHGTHVAGIVAAVADNNTGIAGVSYNAKILPIKVVGDDGKINTAALVKAYQYLRNLIVNGSVSNLHVINMSLGGYSANKNDYALESQIKEMKNDYDIVTVCAGGNEGITAKSYPSDFGACVSVTALDQNGNNLANSDYNKYKDISAPGDYILSTVPGDYAFMSGTSMAAPIVSGVFALLWAQNPNLSVSAAVKSIKATANPVNTSMNYHGSATGSKGAVDAAKAVQYAAANYSNSRKNIRKFTTKVKLSRTAYKYNGKARKPKVTIPGLKEGKDFQVSYKDNVKAGVASVLIKGKGRYTKTITENFLIKKAVNPIRVKGKKFTVKRSEVRKKSKAIKRKYVIAVGKARGKVTYFKKSGNKKIKINKKTGKVAIKKGIKKGTYKVKVKVKAKGNKNFKPRSKTVVFKIVVK